MRWAEAAEENTIVRLAHSLFVLHSGFDEAGSAASQGRLLSGQSGRPRVNSKKGR